MKIGLILAFIIGITMTTAYGIEDSDYYLESENIFVILTLDSKNGHLLSEGGFELEDNTILFEVDTLKKSRITSDGLQGTFFGNTDKGNLFVLKYDLRDEPILMLKVWTDEKIKLVEKATLDNLF